jgi:proteasome lid subunit RPN8/RPN11
MRTSSEQRGEVPTSRATRAGMVRLPLGPVLELQAATFTLERHIGSLTTACIAQYVQALNPQNQSLPGFDLTVLPDMVQSCRSAFDRLTRATQELAIPVVRIPSELFYHASMTLFPAERMAIIGGRHTGHAVTFGPTFDVTTDGPETSRVHVRADPDRLRAALLGPERAGAHLAGWVHSHPGLGPRATEPSTIDRAQHDDWVRDYSSTLVSIIVVADGIVRLWRTAVESRTVRIEVIGSGVTPVPGYEHVFQLA